MRFWLAPVITVNQQLSKREGESMAITRRVGPRYASVSLIAGSSVPGGVGVSDAGLTGLVAPLGSRGYGTGYSPRHTGWSPTTATDLRVDASTKRAGESVAQARSKSNPSYEKT